MFYYINKVFNGCYTFHISRSLLASFSGTAEVALLGPPTECDCWATYGFYSRPLLARFGGSHEVALLGPLQQIYRQHRNSTVLTAPITTKLICPR